MESKASSSQTLTGQEMSGDGVSPCHHPTRSRAQKPQPRTRAKGGPFFAQIWQRAGAWHSASRHSQRALGRASQLSANVWVGASSKGSVCLLLTPAAPILVHSASHRLP